jgi:predicted nucleic acid-binding protein
MSAGRHFLDTNVLIYAFAADDPRSATAEALLARGGIVSVQTLNEFVSVARRKMGMSWEEVIQALGSIRTLCPTPVPLTLEIHEAAVRLAKRYGYSIYDSLVIAAALASSCDTLYSEDMRDKQRIEGLTIRDPFRN